jgi:tetrahydromethanopterin S-methyltransferase subunit B|tara:strand:+ start:5935 stop:6366 length:432 start_codon:yes stop_codon:yes gene_type:complete
MANALRKIIISLIIFSIVFVGMTLIVGEMANSYEINVTEEWSPVYNKINNITNLNDNLANKIENSSTTSDDALDTTIKGSYGVLKLTFDSFDLIHQIGDAIANQTGMTTGSGSNLGFIMNGFYAIVITIIIFSIVSAVFRQPL